MSNEIQFLLYSMPDADGKVQVVVKDETLWCTQKAMAQLFGIDKSGISRHISNIYKTGELLPDTTVAKIATVVNRGIRGNVEELVDFYHLDMIIAVGYRVNSAKATKFRQWATKILSEYIKKGFVMDDERLKQGTEVFGKDYFRELLERVRSIRASERRIWHASGTNHTLPTNGYAKAYSGVSLDSFIRKITFQEIKPEGLNIIGPAIELMAANEQLDAHKNAVSVRLGQLENGNGN